MGLDVALMEALGFIAIAALQPRLLVFSVRYRGLFPMKLSAAFGRVSCAISFCPLAQKKFAKIFTFRHFLRPRAVIGLCFGTATAC